MASCQVTGIPDGIWKAFRHLCLEENVSANRKLLSLIQEYVEQADSRSEGFNREELGNEGR